MLKYEFKKYILKPSVIIFLLILLVINLVKIIEIYYHFGGGKAILNNEAKQSQKGYAVVYEIYGGEITSQKTELLKQDIERAEKLLSEIGITETPVEGTYCGFPYGDVNMLKDVKSNYEYAILYPNTSNSVKNKAQKDSEFYKGKNDYLYRRSLIKAESFKSRRVSAYVKPIGYEMLFDYKFSAVLGMLAVIFVISPIISRERLTGFDKLIVSYKKMGAVIRAKLCVAMIFAVFVSIFLFISDVFYMSVIYGFDNLSQPVYALQSFKYCPLNITLFGGMLLKHGFNTVFLLMFTAIVTFASAISKNDIIATALSVAAAFLLVVGAQELPGVLNPTSLVSVKSTFESLETVNFFGFPIISIFGTLIFTIMITAVFVTAIVIYSRKVKC